MQRRPLQILQDRMYDSLPAQELSLTLLSDSSSYRKVNRVPEMQGAFTLQRSKIMRVACTNTGFSHMWSPDILFKKVCIIVQFRLVSIGVGTGPL